MNTVIISRHEATIKWLKSQGIEAPVIERATADDVRGRVVYGNLPLHLAALATKVIAVTFEDLPRGKRGGELSADEVARHARLVPYVIRTESDYRYKVEHIYNVGYQESLGGCSHSGGQYAQSGDVLSSDVDLSGHSH